MRKLWRGDATSRAPSFTERCKALRADWAGGPRVGVVRRSFVAGLQTTGRLCVSGAVSQPNVGGSGMRPGFSLKSLSQISVLHASGARLALATAVTGACLGGGAGSALAAATTYTVSGFGDSLSGSCTPSNVCSNLRSAVAVAETHLPATVELATGTYTLTQGELDIDVSDGGSVTALTISGAGAGQTVIDQTTTGSRVLDFSGGGPYAVEDLEITGGNATGSSLNGAVGGGIDAGATSLELSRVLITGNSVVGRVGQNGNSSSPGGTGGEAYGGGLYDDGTSEQIDDSTISGNTATGGLGGSPGSGSPSNEVAGA